MRGTDTPRRRFEPVRRWVDAHATPLAALFVSRVGLVLVVYLGMVFIPIRDGEGLWRAYPDDLVLDGWLRWDAGWYRHIVEDGYTNVRTAIGQDTGQFPLYPLVVRGARLLIGDSYLAGLAVSNVAFVAAVLILYRLVLRLHGEDVARRAVVLLLVYPFSFFFNAMYTESLFLLGVLGAFYFGERRRWLPAALCAAAAGATRAVGLLTVIGLAVFYLEDVGFDVRKIGKNVLWLLVGLVGPVGYMTYLGVAFGNPLQFVSSQYAWGTLNPFADMVRVIRSSWSLDAPLSGTFPAMLFLHLMVLPACLVLLAYAFRRLRPSYVVWSLLVVLCSVPRWGGLGRYVLVVFPLYIAAALLLKRETWYHVVVYVSTLLLAFFAILFSHWYWVA